MKSFLSLVFLSFALSLSAQDYYLAKDKNKEPLKGSSIADITKILKQQGKDGKYKPLILTQNASEAVFILVPRSLSVSDGDEGFYIGLDEVNSDGVVEIDGFDLTVVLKSEPNDIDAQIKEYSAEAGTDIKVARSQEVYGRIKYDKYSFNTEDGSRSIILQAPFAGKFVEFTYASSFEAEPKADNAKAAGSKNTAVKKDKYEAVLGIAASSLNRIIFGKEAVKPVIAADMGKSGAGEASEAVIPVIEGWKTFKISTRETKTTFDIVEGMKTSSYSATLPADFIFKPEGKANPRIILKDAPDAFMWLEPVYKGSKDFSDEMIVKYSPGKKFSQVNSKIKIGGKDISFVKKTALNANAYTYFFVEGGQRFALSFIAPAGKLAEFERAASLFLNRFKVVN